MYPMVTFVDSVLVADADSTFERDDLQVVFDCKAQVASSIRNPPRFMAHTLKAQFQEEPWWRSIKVDGSLVVVTSATKDGLTVVSREGARILKTINQPEHIRLFVTEVENLKSAEIKKIFGRFGKVIFFKRLGDLDQDCSGAALLGLVPSIEDLKMATTIQYVKGGHTFSLKVGPGKPYTPQNALADKDYTNKENQPKGFCFAYRAGENCRYGDKCRFRHDMDQNDDEKDQARARKQPKGVCFRFQTEQVWRQVSLSTRWETDGRGLESED